jgi:antitoxin component YwqK of YwqJK toxin-antitoxin module
LILVLAGLITLGREVHEVASSAKQKRVKHVEYHRDGSIRASGWKRGGKLDGQWEWFRLDGTRLRSGGFDMDRQVGEWTTYDRRGQPYKITRMKPVGADSRPTAATARRSSSSRSAR